MNDIVRVSKKALEKARKSRPQGYIEDVMSYVISEDDENIYIKKDDILTLSEKYRPGSLLSKAINFGSSVVKHINNKMINVSKEIQEERLKICSSCPEYNNGTCNKCGCLLDVKTSWASEKCPIDLWKEIPTGGDSGGGCGCGKK